MGICGKRICSISRSSSMSGLRRRDLFFWHQEVASGPFCLLLNCPWLLVFVLLLFCLSLSTLTFYCWKGIHFSWSLDLIFVNLFLLLVVQVHFYFQDLLRVDYKKYEILNLVLFLASEALLFVSFFWASFHSLSSPTLGILLAE